MINNILLIEDEKPNADRLKRLLKCIYPKAAITFLDSIADSVIWFNTNKVPDVVLMDIRLADGLCFEIFEKTKVGCPVIFTTAYDEYALRAFKFNGIDYLLKPVEQDELKAAFDKLESFSLKQQPLPLDSLLQFLKPSEYRSRFLLSYKDGYKSIQVNDIAYFYSELKITKAKLQNGTEETIPLTLEELELQLNPKLFFRANRQFIIHIDAIQHVHNYFNSKLKLKLSKNSNIEVIVSRDKAALLKTWLDF
jgi:two-component system, LytTR family, response regulator LytT